MLLHHSRHSPSLQFTCFLRVWLQTGAMLDSRLISTPYLSTKTKFLTSSNMCDLSPWQADSIVPSSPPT